MAIFETAQRSRLAPTPPSQRGVEVAATSAAVAFLIITAWASAGPSPGDWLGDPDDALRLVSARALLGGAPWFDPTLERVGAPEPLVSHWSRLVDLPLAALIGALRPILGQDLGELATRLFWPTAWFAVLCAAVGREAYRSGGASAAAGAAALAATSIGATGQFRPGRIDHHNVQIVYAVAGLLFPVRSLDDRRLGWQAGGLLGLGLAVGYEAIALVVPALALAALIALLDPARRLSLVPAAAATTGTLMAACLLTIPPAGWLKIHCDALSPNIVVLAASGTLGLWEAQRFAVRFATRLAFLSAAVGTGAAIFAVLEPACLAGPFGQIDPALKSIWLDHVLETKSLQWFVRQEPAFALAQFAFLLAGAGAQATLEAGVSLTGGLLAASRRPGAATATTADPRRARFFASSLRTLAAQRPGLVAADLDLGLFVLTPHRVVAAPYHRLNQGILANHAILEAPPARAEPTMRALGVDDVALCNGPIDPGRRPVVSLREALLGNEPVDFLTELGGSPEAAAVRLCRRAPP